MEPSKFEAAAPASEDLFVNQIFRLILLERWKIGMIMLAFLLLGIGGGLYFAQYRSEGFLQFGGPIPGVKMTSKDSKDPKDEPRPGIALANYKRYAAAFGTTERFNEFVQQSNLGDFPGVRKLRMALSSKEGISHFIEPVFPFTKLDAKELMDQPKDAGNNLIGLKFSYEGDSPENARQIVGLLGRYTVDTIAYLVYSDALRFKHSEITAEIERLENLIIENNFHRDEMKRQGVALRAIVSKYPGAVTSGAPQVISVTGDSARYLSPSVHLMSTEVIASEIDERIVRAKREQLQDMLFREYYDKVKVFLDKTKSGEAILRGLEPIKDEVFKRKDLSDETIKQVFNTITIENQSGTSLYLEKTRFIAGPSLPAYRSSRLGLTVMMSLVVGFLFAMVIVLVPLLRRKASA